MQEVGLRILLALGAVPALSPAHRHYPSRERSQQGYRSRLGGQPCDDLRDEAQLGVQTPREDCTVVRIQNSLVKTIPLPDMRNVMHNLCEPRAFCFWDDW